MSAGGTLPSTDGHAVSYQTKMELCKYCRNIDFQAAFPPPKYSRGPRSSYSGYKHHPDLASMRQAAKMGCELCSFFLICAEGTPRMLLGMVQDGRQLYLRGADMGCMFITTDRHPRLLPDVDREGRVHSIWTYFCRFDCFAPHSK